MSNKNDGRFGTIEVARRVRISVERLYYWERIGIVNPEMESFGIRQFRRYSREDIERAKRVKELVDIEGYTLQAAKRRIVKR